MPHEDLLNWCLAGNSHNGESAGENATQYKADTFACMDALVKRAENEGRDLLASEAREYDRMEKIFDQLSVIEQDHTVDRRGLAGLFPGFENPKAEAPYRAGMPLKDGQSFLGFMRARGEDVPESVADACRNEMRDLSLAKYLRGAFTGDWRDAAPERELMAISGTSSGGVLLPGILTASIIDRAREKTRVMQAGALTVPMENRKVDVPRWVTDPHLAWRKENDPIAESDPTLDKVTLNARSLATVTKVSRELVEDTTIAGALEDAFAAALATSIDSVALYGSGTDPEPRGVKAYAEVTKTPLGANGAAATWAALVESVGRLRDASEEPTAQIMADRTTRKLALLTGGDGQYIAPPEYLAEVPRLTTALVPTNLTVGTSSDTSDLFTADWTQLLIGVRTGLQITLLTERYMPDAGQYGFVAWWRGDTAVCRPKAFDVVTGIR